MEATTDALQDIKDADLFNLEETSGNHNDLNNEQKNMAKT